MGVDTNHPLDSPSPRSAVLKSVASDDGHDATDLILSTTALPFLVNLSRSRYPDGLQCLVHAPSYMIRLDRGEGGREKRKK
jgi:hypothetical protein